MSRPYALRRSCSLFVLPFALPLTLPFALLLTATGCTRSPPPTDPSAVIPSTSGVDLPTLPLDPNLQYNHTFLQQGEQDFAAWSRQGVGLSRSGGPVSPVGVTLAPQRSGTLSCQGEDIDGGAAHFDAAVGLCAGQDPLPSGLPSGVNHYNGGAFYYGTMVSKEVPLRAPIDHLIASWNAITPPGTWLQLRVRVRLPSGLSSWYRLPVWASDPGTVKRHSVKVAADDTGYVDTDTFELRNQKAATSYQLAATLFSADGATFPTVYLIGAVASMDKSAYPTMAADESVFGTNLAVPQRSQELAEYKKPEYQPYGGGGQVWCSPTSTSMVMEYWSQVTKDARKNVSVPDAAIGCYDWVYKGTGNWPFNTAYAANFGMIGYVTRFYSFAHAAPWIAAKVPLIISIAFKAGELPGAPISKTNGHLIVVRGFAKNGDVIVNDPAARDDASVQLTYPRAALEAAWAHSHRTAYLIYPSDWPQHPSPTGLRPQ